jgi:ribonucleoside-diphosphate reductase beta chain
MAVTEREQAEADLDWTPRPGVLRVGDIRVDDALLFIDRGVETMPSYLDLFRRWETQQWSVNDLDFSLDRKDWVKLREFDRQSVLWMRRMFFSGEERVTSTLAPFLWAAPSPEIEMFLSTQILDESRHTLFFDRWFREVVATGAQDMTESLAKTRPHVNECYEALFDVRLPEAAQRLARNPTDVNAFIQGITLYHIVLEAALGLTGMRFELMTMRRHRMTNRGYHQGFTAVARDESRHVSFGVKVLRDAVREDPRRFAPLIQQTVVECLPLISGALSPPDPRYLTQYGRSDDEVNKFAIGSLNRRLRAIGIRMVA